MKILIIEDEIDLNNVLCKQLIKNNYIVDKCFNGEEALDYICISTYDLIISDCLMPKMDGFTFLKEIRRKNIDTPLIFLTAKDQIDDKIEGLDLGANDYMIKPFQFEELLARIRVLTRKNNQINTNILSCANLTLDIKTHEVKRGDTHIELSSKEWSLLKYLLLNKNIVLSRDKIETAVWNQDYDGASNMIDVYIRYLRKKVDDNFEPKLIQTIRGSGYVLKESEK